MFNSQGESSEGKRTGARIDQKPQQKSVKRIKEKRKKSETQKSEKRKTGRAEKTTSPTWMKKYIPRHVVFLAL